MLGFLSGAKGTQVEREAEPVPLLRSYVSPEDAARAFALAVEHTYARIEIQNGTTFGIEPEAMDYSTMKVTSPGYPLRPEIIESAYYLQFFTGDPRYRAMGRTLLDSLRRYCRTDIAYAALRNVETKEKTDGMESFFLAETLKYLYLLFAPQETLDLRKIVFNTEAHPIRRTW